MTNIDNLFGMAPFSLNSVDKADLLDAELLSLTRHHYSNCSEYRRMLDGMRFDPEDASSATDLPFLPVRLFKDHDLYSIDKSNIVKTMTSSGTSGQQVSKIYLSKETSLNQTKALVKIVSEVIGSKRAPMIILDSPSVLKNRKMFSARGAGILGFSLFGTKRIYALNDDMELDVEGITAFIREHQDSKILLFGFTFMVYQHFIKVLQSRKIDIDLSDAVMIHGGGWKKLQGESVSSAAFRRLLKDLCGLDHVYDYYGMVEQTGSIYMECEFGHLHASIFSDIIIRDPRDFSVCLIGERGIIQTLSVLPKSYPGHSLLTEDEGVLLGVDDCQCGRLGKYLKIFGRIKNAEIRGCSDTYEQ